MRVRNFAGQAFRGLLVAALTWSTALAAGQDVAEHFRHVADAANKISALAAMSDGNENAAEITSEACQMLTALSRDDLFQTMTAG